MMIRHRDRLFTTLGAAVLILALVPLVAMVVDLLRLGLPVLEWQFVVTNPENAGRGRRWR